MAMKTVDEGVGNETRTLTVLVVDDDRSTVDLLCHCLRREKFEAIGAMSGEEAIMLAAQQPVDIVVLDLTMPDIDGFAVCRELKRSSKTREVPIIVLTAHDDPQVRARGIRLGISDYVVKPTTREEIMRRIRLQADAVRKQHEADSMIINFPRRQRA